MKLAIFGASGATGHHVVKQSLAAGHNVHVLLRTEGSLNLKDKRITSTIGTLQDAESVLAVVQNADVVISVLGARSNDSLYICSEGVRSILHAMERSGTRRLIALSAYGASETKAASWFIRLVRKIIREKMNDKDVMESLVRESGIDWTLIRAPALTNGKANGKYRSSTSLKPGISGYLPREDLASFILDVSERNLYIREAPTVSL